MTAITSRNGFQQPNTSSRSKNRLSANEVLNISHTVCNPPVTVKMMIRISNIVTKGRVCIFLQERNFSRLLRPNFESFFDSDGCAVE